MDQGHRNWLHVITALNRGYDHVEHDIDSFICCCWSCLTSDSHKWYRPALYVEHDSFILRQHLRKPSSISKAGAASIVPVDAVGESLKSHVG